MREPGLARYQRASEWRRRAGADIRRRQRRPHRARTDRDPVRDVFRQAPQETFLRPTRWRCSKRMGLREHLTPQRSNGFRAMVERIRSDARAALDGRRRITVPIDACYGNSPSVSARWRLRGSASDGRQPCRGGQRVQQSKVPRGADGRICRSDLQHPVDRLLSVLRGANFYRAARASAGLRRRGDIPVRRHRRRSGGAAQFASIRHRRTGQFDLRRHRGHGGDRYAPPCRSWRRRSSRAHPDRHVVSDGVHRVGALRSRLHARRPRHPVRSLSGDRRLSRRHRLVDDHRRDPGDHRSAAGVDQHWRVL